MNSSNVFFGCGVVAGKHSLNNDLLPFEWDRALHRKKEFWIYRTLQKRWQSFLRRWRYHELKEEIHTIEYIGYLHSAVKMSPKNLPEKKKEE